MTYKIYENFFEEVEKKLNRIAKKCAKNGNPFTFEVIGTALEMLFEKFNINYPADYKGRSLSVSDVISFVDGTRMQVWFCDSYGWTKVNAYKWIEAELN